MRSLLVVTIFTAVGAFSGTTAGAEQLQGSPPLLSAPIGHVQPRASDFSPRSRANEAEQDRLSTFDANQQKRDEMLDRKLSICRC